MKIETLEVAGFLPAITGMRNPMNSWHLNDSRVEDGQVILGEKDLDLAQRLIKAGGEHRKFLRQIRVWADMDMPRYWWSEMDTYHYNTKNSCSTMHKLLNEKEPILPEHFIYCIEDVDILDLVINRLNAIREIWLEAKKRKDNATMERCLLRAKRLLTEGFLQLRTVETNYEEIRNVYHQRKHHRLKEEWSYTFCAWVESLPYFNEFIK